MLWGFFTRLVLAEKIAKFEIVTFCLADAKTRHNSGYH
jgi:hypothetical protein